MARYEKLQGMSRSQLTSARTTWGMIVAASIVAPIIGGVLLRAAFSPANMVTGLPLFNEEIDEAIAVAFYVVVFSAIVLRMYAAYTLNSLKAMTRTEAGLWAAVSVLLHGFVWLVVYAMKPDKYACSDERGDKQDIMDHATGISIDYTTLLAELPPDEAAKFRGWSRNLEYFLGQSGFADTRASDIDLEALWYGYTRSMSPEDFWESGRYHRASVPTITELRAMTSD